MDDFEPSPRASKRPRTGTYATRRTTLSSLPSGLSEDSKKSTRRSIKKSGRDASPEENLIRQQADHAEKSTERKTGGRKTAEDEFADVQANAKAETRSKRSRKGQGAAEDTAAQEPPKSKEKEPDIVQTRSAGRGRGRTRNESSTLEQPVQIASPMKQTAKPSIANHVDSDQAPAAIFSPQPRGILTPSRHGRGQRSGPRKSVNFEDDVAVDDRNEKQIEEHFGFKDISSSSKKKSKLNDQRVPESPDDQEEEVFEDAAEYPEGQEMNGINGEHVEEENDSILNGLGDEEDIPTTPRSTRGDSTKATTSYATEDEDPHLISIKLQVLSRVTNHSSSSAPLPIPSYLETQYATLHSLLSATVTAGESNSLLLLGSRGSGKSLLIEHALSNLQRSHADDFHAVRLNGFFQTDDKLALREIWRQLGREMSVPEDETGEVSSYADTMASLLSLLSHPEELGEPDAMDVDAAMHEERDGMNRTSKSVIFIMDEFDLFTTHPRQTLLYNLFDIAQAKKAPIAVIGCSTRMDVVECLEKRVKSRFSHRWLHVPAAKSLVVFEESIRAVLSLPTEGKDALGVAKEELESRGRWNEFIKAQFLPAPTIRAVVKKTFYSTKSIPDVLTALYIPIATLSLPATKTQASNQAKSLFSSTMDIMASSPSLLTLLPHLPLLHLSLLISATRLETIYDVTILNFTLVHKQYTDLLARSKLQRSSLSSFSKGGALTGAGLRSWSKDTARGAWEELAQWEFVVPASGVVSSGRLGDEGLGGDGILTKMFRVDVTLDDVAWAIKAKLGGAGAGETLIKWCKEI